jgi:hypothetical protein
LNEFTKSRTGVTVYSVTIINPDGTVTSHTMTWRQVRRYLPGGSLYGTVTGVSLHRIVSA